MVRKDGKRNFALIGSGGEEVSVFSGATPRQAATKAVRRLQPEFQSEDEAKRHPTEIRLHERGTNKVHVYEGWAWEEKSSDEKPDWMPEEVTEANVSKKGIERIEDVS